MKPTFINEKYLELYKQLVETKSIVDYEENNPFVSVYWETLVEIIHKIFDNEKINL